MIAAPRPFAFLKQKMLAIIFLYFSYFSYFSVTTALQVMQLDAT